MNKDTVQNALQKAKHVLANDDAAITDIARLITNHENGKRPYYIYDSVTGAKLGMSQLPVFEKRLSAFAGDILAMFASYKGRDSKPKDVPVAPKVEVPEEPVAPKVEVAEVKAAKRAFKKTKEPGKTHEVATTKTDKDGNPIEQTVTITEGGKVIKKEVRVVEPEDMAEISIG